MTDRKILLIIIFIGVVMSLALGHVNGDFRRTHIGDYRNDAWQYNATALALLKYHTFHDPGSRFYGPFQKGPGYPIFLASVYGVAGLYPIAVWSVQMLLWIISIFFLWKISGYFLMGLWAFLPSLMLALYWGAASYITNINSDLLALFLVISFVYSFLAYSKNKKYQHIISQSCVLGFLILTKPILLYFIPCFFILYLTSFWPLRRKDFFYLVCVVAVAGGMAGAWSYYNYRLLGTPQLASGGLTLMRRADDVNMLASRFRAFVVASMFGDFIADKVYPGYASTPEPYTRESGAREKTYYMRQLNDKSNELQLQQEQYMEARKLIRMHPIKFFITSIPYLMRLNIPVNQKGVEMIHTFVDTRDHLPDFIKVAIMMLTRMIWFLFIIIVGIGAYYAAWSWRLSSVPFLLIVYFNGMYAMVSHAEARYILPVLPLYFIFFTNAVYVWKDGRHLS